MTAPNAASGPHRVSLRQISRGGLLTEHPHDLHAAGPLFWQRFPQSCKLGQLILHAAAWHPLSDGLAAAGDHHGFAGCRPALGNLLGG